MPECNVITRPRRTISIHPTTTVGERLKRHSLVNVEHFEEVSEENREYMNYKVTYGTASTRGLSAGRFLNYHYDACKRSAAPPRRRPATAPEPEPTEEEIEAERLQRRQQGEASWKGWVADKCAKEREARQAAGEAGAAEKAEAEAAAAATEAAPESNQGKLLSEGEFNEWVTAKQESSRGLAASKKAEEDELLKRAAVFNEQRRQKGEKLARKVDAERLARFKAKSVASSPAWTRALSLHGDEKLRKMKRSPLSAGTRSLRAPSHLVHGSAPRFAGEILVDPHGPPAQFLTSDHVRALGGPSGSASATQRGPGSPQSSSASLGAATAAVTV